MTADELRKLALGTFRKDECEWIAHMINAEVAKERAEICQEAEASRQAYVADHDYDRGWHEAMLAIQEIIIARGKP